MSEAEGVQRCAGPPPSFYYTWGHRGSESLAGQPRSHELFQLLLRSGRLRSAALSEPGAGVLDNGGVGQAAGNGEPPPSPTPFVSD